MMYSAPERTANARLDGGGTVALSLALPSVHDALTRRFRDVCKGEPPRCAKQPPNAAITVSHVRCPLALL